jgi:hypothetical protein
MKKILLNLLVFCTSIIALAGCSGSSKSEEFIKLKNEVADFEKKIQTVDLSNNDKSESLIEELHTYEERANGLGGKNSKLLRERISKIKNRIECEISGIGYVKLYCNSINPYDIYVDGIKKWRIPPRNFLIEKIEVGEHLISFEQVSGYVLWKTNPSSRYNFKSCDTVTYHFPFE